MINRLYSNLMQGVTPSGLFYSRRIDAAARNAFIARPEALSLLMPSSAYDAEYRMCVADRLAMLCRRSVFSEQLLAWDPLNTYDTPARIVDRADAGDSVTGPSAPGIVYYILDTTAFHPWVRRRWSLVVDPVGGKAYVDGVEQAFTWTGTLSSIVLMGDMGVQFGGAAPATEFSMTVASVRRPAMALLDILSAAEASDLPWSNTYLPYKDAAEEDVRLAAFIMSCMEQYGV